jgi:hypothetical protein
MTALKCSKMRNCIADLVAILLAGPQAAAAGQRDHAATQEEHCGESTRADNANIELEQAVREQRVNYIFGQIRANATDL